MTNRWKIILIATAFNVLFEYSLRGINNLKVQPVLPFVLIATYFTLFTMIEDLIVRYKLKAYQLMILSFFYGTIYLAYISGLAFIKPSFLGIAWLPLIYVNVVWWGALQAVLTFYFANRICVRDWNHPRLSQKGWIICVGVNFFSIYLFQKSGVIPAGTPIGKLTMLTILIITLVAFTATLTKKTTIRRFQNSKLLNFLSLLTVLLFIFSAIFLTHDPILAATSNVNALSLKIISVYTLVVSVILLGYRFITKKEISV